MFSGGNKNGALGTNGLININNYCTHFIKLGGWQLSGLAIGWMKIFPCGNFLCGNYPGGNFLGGNFLGESFPGWELSGWEFSWVGVVQVGIFRVGVFLGGNCPDETYPGWEYSLAEVFRVGIVRWESFGCEFLCYLIINTYQSSHNKTAVLLFAFEKNKSFLKNSL